MQDQQTNFDRYLDKKLQDPAFRARFEAADHAWDIALQLAALRQARGLTQKQVAELLGTKQQAIARLEDPAYSGLRHLRRSTRREAVAGDGLSLVDLVDCAGRSAIGCWNPSAMVLSSSVLHIQAFEMELS